MDMLCSSSQGDESENELHVADVSQGPEADFGFPD